MQPVDDFVEPFELKPALLGLQKRPGKDRQGRDGPARQGHQAQVFGHNLGGPLIGVVVAAVGKESIGHFGHCLLSVERLRLRE